MSVCVPASVGCGAGTQLVYPIPAGIGWGVLKLGVVVQIGACRVRHAIPVGIKVSVGASELEAESTGRRVPGSTRRRAMETIEEVRFV